MTALLFLLLLASPARSEDSGTDDAFQQSLEGIPSGAEGSEDAMAAAREANDAEAARHERIRFKLDKGPHGQACMDAEGNLGYNRISYQEFKASLAAKSEYERGGECLDIYAGGLHDLDLKGVTLNGAMLRSANLGHVDLSGASIYSADLSGAQLTGARLTKALLFGSDLSHANMPGAVLSGSLCQGADFYNANLSGADLRDAGLFHVDLRSADLRDARLEGAKLPKANLSGADLSQAKAAGADFTAVDFTGADLTGCDMAGATLERALFDDQTRLPFSRAEAAKRRMTHIAKKTIVASEKIERTETVNGKIWTEYVKKITFRYQLDDGSHFDHVVEEELQTESAEPEPEPERVAEPLEAVTPCAGSYSVSKETGEATCYEVK